MTLQLLKDAFRPRRFAAYVIHRRRMPSCEPLEARYLLSGLPTVIDSKTFDGHTYDLLSQTDHTNAVSEATALGGYLVTINSAQENAFLQTAFGGEASYIWIGLFDAYRSATKIPADRDFIWQSGQTTTYPYNWTAGQPDNSSTTEYYTIMNLATGTWNDFGDINFNPGNNDPLNAVVEIDSNPVVDITSSGTPGAADASDTFNPEDGDLQLTAFNPSQTTTLTLSAATLGLPSDPEGRKLILDPNATGDDTQSILNGTVQILPQQSISFSVTQSQVNHTFLCGTITGLVTIAGVNVNPGTGLQLYATVDSPEAASLGVCQGSTLIPISSEGTSFTFANATYDATDASPPTLTFSVWDNATDPLQVQPVTVQSTGQISVTTNIASELMPEEADNALSTTVQTLTLTLSTTQIGTFSDEVIVQTGSPATNDFTNADSGLMENTPPYALTFNVSGTILPPSSQSGGNLTVYGSANADTINLSMSGSSLIADVDGISTTYPASDFASSLVVAAQAGDDVINLAAGLPTGTLIKGNAGNDSIVNNAANIIIHGSPDNDTIITHASGDSINGNKGNDVIKDTAGRDTLFGGPDEDSLTSVLGFDSLFGGVGNDTLSAQNGEPDTLFGGMGPDTLTFDTGIDSVIPSI